MKPEAEAVEAPSTSSEADGAQEAAHSSSSGGESPMSERAPWAPFASSFITKFMSETQRNAVKSSLFL